MTDLDIRVSGLRKSVGDLTILKNVDFEVARGESVAIIGPTGCGKTTTLRVVGGFERDYTGEVELLGAPARGISPQKRPTRTVFQDYGLFPNMNVLGNVGYGLAVRGMDKSEIERRVGDALAMVRLSGYEKKSVRTLSGGERQRVAFARVLVTEPKIVLLDEPFSAIDEALRSAMEIELRNIQRRLGLTFVLVTHNQGEAMALADRLVVMSKGEVAQVGTGKDIYHQPATRFVANFLGEANLIALRDVAGTTGRDSDGSLQLVNPADRRGDVTLCVRPEAIMVGSAAAGLPNRRTATVTNVVFRGPITKVFVTTQAGQEFNITTLSSGAALPERGSTVEIGWSPDSGSLLRD